MLTEQQTAQGLKGTAAGLQVGCHGDSGLVALLSSLSSPASWTGHTGFVELPSPRLNVASVTHPPCVFTCPAAKGGNFLPLWSLWKPLNGCSLHITRLHTVGILEISVTCDDLQGIEDDLHVDGSRSADLCQAAVYGDRTYTGCLSFET